MPPSKRLADYLAFLFLICAVFVIFVFELTVMRPYMLNNKYRFVYGHLTIACIIVFNLYMNIYMLCTTDSSTVGMVMPSKLLPDWKYCYSCEANSPPRSYHCNICDRCILRRDHHCVFTTCCIGYKNYKYYMGLLFQISFACLYATIINSGYILNNMGKFTPLKFFSLIFPIPFFMLRLISSWVLFCNIILMLSVIGFLFSTGLLIYHFAILANNQTTHEKRRSITKFNLKNWRINLEETLGSSWPLTVFVTPLIKSALPRDGTYFPTMEEHKDSQ